MKHAELLSRMTRKEKIALCSGANAWETKAMAKHGIPSLFMSDGPHGLRKQENGTDMLGINESVPATCYPTAATTACSWDPDLLQRMGEAIAAEAASMGVGLVLGPGANLKRDPRCGRNFEYFSEDPYLTGKLAAGEIRGLQKNGVGASLKHFACNSQEYKRFSSNSILDERTLRELYLTGFEIAVKEASPATVMCAYNKLNGTYCSDHRILLTEILREEWGFDGLVVTDWGALHDRTEAFRAGCDLAMPGGSAYLESDALADLKAGRLTDAAVDRCADRVLTLVERQVAAGSFDVHAHHGLARRIAAESAVLLQNTGDILPLKQGTSVALIGALADKPRYQGSGSSHINPTMLPSARQAMAHTVFAPGCREDGSTDGQLLQEAAEAARSAQTAVVFVGLTDRYESEGFDRSHLQLPEGHVRLIEAVAEANADTVVVLTSGGVVECPWAERVKGILYLGLPGQAGGEAAADLLWGTANPCGKLAETWPLELAHCPTADSYGSRDALYREGIYVGYRYYDKAEQPVRWRFGHGLSYTTFAYSDPAVDGCTVSVTVTNTGKVPGAEVVQLYVLPPKGGLHRPVRELKGFTKVFLQPGECRTVQLELNDRSFALWQDGWVVPDGVYTILVGDQALELSVKGQTVPAPSWQAGSWYEAPCGTPTPEQWQPLLGYAYREPVIEKGSFTMENTILEMAPHSLLMRLLRRVVLWYIGLSFREEKTDDNPAWNMMVASSCDAALSNIQINGKIPGHLFHGLVAFANGRILQGLRYLVKR